MKAIASALLWTSLLAAANFASEPAASLAAKENVAPADPKQAKPADSVVCELIWDDTVDDGLGGEAKKCRVALDYREGKISGTFDGPVLGVKRNAKFVGKTIEAGRVSLLILEQQEENYTCVYQLQAAGGKCTGVWHDTRGGKGDVELRETGND